MEALVLSDFFSLSIRGVVHVGANHGEEFSAYVAHDIRDALWIEPIPVMYQTLKAHISSCPSHIAIEAVCLDRDGQSVEFNVASNRGESSSIFKSTLHSSFFPEITFEEKIVLTSKKLDTILSDNALDPQKYNFLVIDTQGAELLVLRGASNLLRYIDAIYVEVSERPLYEGSCTWPDIHEHLTALGFSMKHLHIGRHFYGNAFYLHRRVQE